MTPFVRGVSDTQSTAFHGLLQKAPEVASRLRVFHIYIALIY